MAKANTQVTVRILERDYQVACPPEEREALLNAADYLSQQMAEVRDSGRVVGMERIAVMVALNLAHEYLGADHDRQGIAENVTRRIEKLRLSLADGAGEGAGRNGG
ncbi:MAG: cell division protein ZapA [Gammaproteobacteria bacterium]|nr:cell division protein ZapA [Gammaproteobacteria bacterium]